MTVIPLGIEPVLGRFLSKRLKNAVIESYLRKLSTMSIANFSLTQKPKLRYLLGRKKREHQRSATHLIRLLIWNKQKIFYWERSLSQKNVYRETWRVQKDL